MTVVEQSRISIKPGDILASSFTPDDPLARNPYITYVRVQTTQMGGHTFGRTAPDTSAVIYSKPLGTQYPQTGEVQVDKIDTTSTNCDQYTDSLQDKNGSVMVYSRVSLCDGFGDVVGVETLQVIPVEALPPQIRQVHFPQLSN